MATPVTGVTRTRSGRGGAMKWTPKKQRKELRPTAQSFPAVIGENKKEMITYAGTVTYDDL